MTTSTNIILEKFENNLNEEKNKNNNNNNNNVICIKIFGKGNYI